jgi:hypothetical protein
LTPGSRSRSSTSGTRARSSCSSCSSSTGGATIRAGCSRPSASPPKEIAIELRGELEGEKGFAQTLLSWRLESTSGALRFVDGLLAPAPPAPPAEAQPPAGSGRGVGISVAE